MRYITTALAFALLLSSCQTLQQNLDARKNLSKCKYEFKKIKLKGIDISGAKVRTANFDLYLKITNNAATDVALDRVEGDVYLDKNKTMRLSHEKFIRIKPNKSVVEPIALNVPILKAVRSLGHKPKYLTIKAKVYATLMIGGTKISSPYPFKVNKRFRIPWGKIQRQLKKEGKKRLRNLF